MKKTLLIITALLFITSTAFPQTKMDINNLIDRSGLLYKPNDDKPFTGIVFDLYENGQKKLEGRYRNGLKNGKWTWWNRDGSIVKRGTYKNQLMNGLWQFYFSNGNLKGKGQYRDGNGTNRGDTGISRHGRHSKWTFWYDSGQKESEITFKNGIPDGLVTSWYENGQKEGEGTIKNGEPDGLTTNWYENGQKSSEVTFKDGIPDGKATIWYENGQKKEDGTYKDGEKDGLTTNWYENGQKSSEGTAKDGIPDGLVTGWYEYGQKSSEGTYKDGKRDGLFTDWYVNGQKMMEGNWKNGELDGLVTRWYEDGREIIPIIPEFVAVEGGTFQMGSNSVTVSDFNISKTEVTFEEYDAFCDATGSDKPHDFNWGRGERPVMNVSWRDAVAFCEWMSKVTGKTYRLPTEAEWDYAARGGNKSKDYDYSGSNDLDAVGWYRNNSGSKTHPVAEKQPNELGLYDMSGNVWEYCSDWYDEDYYSRSPRTDPQGPNSGSSRVLRGGSWLGSVFDCRVASRLRFYPGLRGSAVGFRLVLSQDSN